ncbi:MAG: YgjV family protein [Clostridia bacterium]|nr:YgjV family protein [Clostridia bacterium]
MPEFNLYQFIAQAIGVAAMILAYFIYSARKRRTLITLKFISDALWGTHYFMLGATSGAVLNGINMIRETVFQLKTSHRWAQSPLWAVVFIAINLGSTVLSWQGPQSLLPAVGASIAVVGLWCASPLTIRLFSLPSTTCWLIYAALSKTPSGIICNVIQLAAIFVGLYHDIQERRAQKTGAAGDEPRTAPEQE